MTAGPPPQSTYWYCARCAHTITQVVKMCLAGMTMTVQISSPSALHPPSKRFYAKSFLIYRPMCLVQSHIWKKEHLRLIETCISGQHSALLLRATNSAVCAHSKQRGLLQTVEHMMRPCCRLSSKKNAGVRLCSHACVAHPLLRVDSLSIAAILTAELHSCTVPLCPHAFNPTFACIA